MADTPKVSRRLIDGHTHIGALGAFKYYDLKEPLNVTVYEFDDTKDYIKNHLDKYNIERSLVISNYGVPIQEQPFSLNPLVIESTQASDRLYGAIWTSWLPRNRELTMEALKHAREKGIVALKITFLLGGTPDPNKWDDETREIATACLETAEKYDLAYHFHTSPGGNADISNYVPLVEQWGKRVKMYLVHCGGGVSGQIKLVPKFLDWVEQGYKVWTDVTWTTGFGPRLLLTEIERRGVGYDRVLFSSDEPWSDFWGEYWKIQGAPVSEELKDRVFYQNFLDLYGDKVK
ncbi:MAG: amidohydrolase family protein [Candidatus Dormiibacterota bacterium]|jgi:predicted TIM-barrel fold metal-dependent hydrolase